ncbi:coiled-coil domain-containing protein 93-like isoform X1 [Drosophila miranda]|uniref:coiled-coil domain-containing protein 93-like isoform X1 n=1 Tax=Drosophila miranda TaxID=7229 RepID=UPI00143F3239|nr:coiled-coil domain-containing protein 93-like isoform X1 [Drosophila miranda]XP_033250488.1 coiled-coil domain-containing protein 93-like isoform X1 [Drosophila miranda]
MANRDVFSKILPNVKLATRYDEDGREVQVESREDSDATAKQQDTFDILMDAGYYRARIKGLSAFDKVVGGMTWCIECADYDEDVDLLFHESLSIGQKIALVEKIVSVLIDMKCPHSLEPHPVQGLEFLAIHPVIQWLVKTSVENRAVRGQRLKKFAIGVFHNHYQYKSDKDNLTKIRCLLQLDSLQHRNRFLMLLILLVVCLCIVLPNDPDISLLGTEQLLSHMLLFSGDST